MIVSYSSITIRNYDGTLGFKLKDMRSDHNQNSVTLFDRLHIHFKKTCLKQNIF